MASDVEDWTGSTNKPRPLALSLELINARAGMDAELFRVVSKVVEELGLE